MTEPARAWSYDELVGEGVSLIPAYAPAWTNHNAADPGITLVELFAYFGEILGYRALRITPDAKLNFLHLLDGNESTSAALRGCPSARLDMAITARVQALAQEHCAVTLQDFERAALEAARGHPECQGAVSAVAIAGVDLRRGQGVLDPAATARAAGYGDISIIVAPERELPPDALNGLCQHVQEALSRRCLLTTRAYVVGPVDLQVEVACRLGLNDGVTPAQAARRIDAALRRRFGPAPVRPAAGEIDRDDDSAEDHDVDDDDFDADVRGQATGRPFGRSLHLSEITGVIDRVPGVDWVDDVAVWRIGSGAESVAQSVMGLRVGVVSTIALDTRLGGRASIALRRLQRGDDGAAQTVLLQPWERVRVRLAPDGLVDANGALPGVPYGSGSAL